MSKTMGMRGPRSTSSKGYGSLTKKGYLRIWDTKQLRWRMEHDVVWESTNGLIPEGMQVHHKNENKLDNRLENLELLDAVTHKRVHSGCIFVDGQWLKPCKYCGGENPITKDFWYFQNGYPHLCKKCAKARANEYYAAKVASKKTWGEFL